MGSDCRDWVLAGDIRFLPGVLVVNTVSLRLLIDVEGVFFSGLFLALERHDSGILLAVVPVVDNLVAGDDDVSLAHLDVLGLNGDGLAVNGAADGVAEDDVPLVSLILILGY